MAKRNETLQALCRDYLGKLRYMGKKYGIDVDGLIRLNRQKRCEATQREVELLSRAVDDEHINRIYLTPQEAMGEIIRRFKETVCRQACEIRKEMHRLGYKKSESRKMLNYKV